MIAFGVERQLTRGAVFAHQHNPHTCIRASTNTHIHDNISTTTHIELCSNVPRDVGRVRGDAVRLHWRRTRFRVGWRCWCQFAHNLFVSFTRIKPLFFFLIEKLIFFVFFKKKNIFFLLDCKRNKVFQHDVNHQLQHVATSNQIQNHYYHVQYVSAMKQQNKKLKIIIILIFLKNKHTLIGPKSTQSNLNTSVLARSKLSWAFSKMRSPDEPSSPNNSQNTWDKRERECDLMTCMTRIRQEWITLALVPAPRTSAVFTVNV